MSGSEAAPGTCPAAAYRMPTRTVAATRAVRYAMRVMSRLPGAISELTRARIEPRRGRYLDRRRSGRRQRLADREPHNGNLLLLGHDDLLRQPPDLRIAAIAQHRNRHVDCTLMMRNHHCDKIRI